MQTHPRSETLTTHRSSNSHLLATSSPTRCNLPSLIVQVTRVEKLSLLGDSLLECPLWVTSGHMRRNTPCPLYPRKRTLIGGGSGGSLPKSCRNSCSPISRALA